mmetsp:Transcript_5989/g.11471  ORF Transcript_5989/g.11471 Transcript_5989/m.11471 type:complete len:95 (-) Transcript_5989:678-962(-)
MDSNKKGFIWMRIPLWNVRSVDVVAGGLRRGREEKERTREIEVTIRLRRSKKRLMGCFLKVFYLHETWKSRGRKGGDEKKGNRRKKKKENNNRL